MESIDNVGERLGKKIDRMFMNNNSKNFKGSSDKSTVEKKGLAEKVTSSIEK